MGIQAAAYSSSYYGSSSSDGGAGLLIIIFLVLLMFIPAYIVAINMFIEAAERKGNDVSTGMLWFVGIFLSPIVVGLYVAALPDLSKKVVTKEEATEAELPDL